VIVIAMKTVVAVGIAIWKMMKIWMDVPAEVRAATTIMMIWTGLAMGEVVI